MIKSVKKLLISGILMVLFMVSFASMASADSNKYPLSNAEITNQGASSNNPLSDAKGITIGANGKITYTLPSATDFVGLEYVAGWHIVLNFYDADNTLIHTTRPLQNYAGVEVTPVYKDQVINNVKKVELHNTDNLGPNFMQNLNLYTGTPVSPEPTEPPEPEPTESPPPVPTNPPEPTPEPTPVPTPTPPPPLKVSYQPNKTAIVVDITGGKAPYTVIWSKDGVELGNISTKDYRYRITDLEPETNYTISVIDANNEVVVEIVNTGSFEGYVPPTFPSPADMFQKMIDNFGVAGSIAIAVIAAAVALGLIVILGIWGWRLAKKWLNAAK